MCIGQPMQVLSKDGDHAVCASANSNARVDIRLVPDAAEGDWLLVFLGAARRVMSEAEALAVADALSALEAAAHGDALDGYFADLSAGPRLPEHMETARRAGAKTA